MIFGATSNIIATQSTKGSTQDTNEVLQRSANKDTQEVSLESVFLRAFDRVHLVSNRCGDSGTSFSCFKIDGVLQYDGFCDDFGPMNLGTIFRFCEILGQQIAQHKNACVAMITEPDPKALTNAVFLLGAYMIMKRGGRIDTLMTTFNSIMKLLPAYRDVSPGPQNFDLYLQDCWGGLLRAKALGWVNFEAKTFYHEAYFTNDNPLNADLHEIVPGKFVAMRGPRELSNGQTWEDVISSDGEFSHRDFSPAHYVDILHNLNVRTVMRLNAAEYDRGEFVNAGIAVADLAFADCTSPPPAIIAKFMAIAKAVPGAIAVHCKAGLGRTGTLIGLYLMKNYGFTAREAIGWIRIVRPGSVIGTQQHFLCDKEPLLRRNAGITARAANAWGRLAERADVVSLEDFISLVIKDIDWQVLEFRRMRALQNRDSEGSDSSEVAPSSQRPMSWTAGASSVAKNESARRALAAHVKRVTERRAALRIEASTRFQVQGTTAYANTAVLSGHSGDPFVGPTVRHSIDCLR